MLAAVVLAAAISIADLGAFARLFHQRRSEFLLAVVSFLGVVIIGVIQGIFLAVMLSLLLFLRRAWWPHDAVLGRATGRARATTTSTSIPGAKQIPGLVLYRFDAPLLFFNAEAFRERVLVQVAAADPPARWVVVASEPITDVDTTAAESLELLLEELDAAGVTLAFAELKDPVKVRLRRYGTMDKIGEDRCYPTLGTAVDGYVAATRADVGGLGGRPQGRGQRGRPAACRPGAAARRLIAPLRIRRRRLREEHGEGSASRHARDPGDPR